MFLLKIHNYVILALCGCYYDYRVQKYLLGVTGTRLLFKFKLNIHGLHKKLKALSHDKIVRYIFRTLCASHFYYAPLIEKS